MRPETCDFDRRAFTVNFLAGQPHEVSNLNNETIARQHHIVVKYKIDYHSQHKKGDDIFLSLHHIIITIAHIMTS